MRLTKNNITKTKGKYKPKALLILIDEMSEVMSCSDFRKVTTIQESIGSIARLGRAAGVHLCLATQRPSSNIINSDLKNNIQQSLILGDFDAGASSLIFDEDVSHLSKPEIKGRGFIKSGKEITEFQSYWTEPKKDFRYVDVKETEPVFMDERQKNKREDFNNKRSERMERLKNKMNGGDLNEIVSNTNDDKSKQPKEQNGVETEKQKNDFNNDISQKELIEKLTSNDNDINAKNNNENNNDLNFIDLLGKNKSKNKMIKDKDKEKDTSVDTINFTNDSGSNINNNSAIESETVEEKSIKENTENSNEKNSSNNDNGINNNNHSKIKLIKNEDSKNTVESHKSRGIKIVSNSNESNIINKNNRENNNNDNGNNCKTIKIIKNTNEKSEKNIILKKRSDNNNDFNIVE